MAFFGVRSEFVFLLYFFDDFFRVRLDFVRFSQVLFLCASFCNFSLFTRCSGPSLIACCPECPIYQITRLFTAFHGFLTASEPDKTDHRPRHPPPEGGQEQQAPGSGQRLYRQNDGFDRFCTAKHSGFLRFSRCILQKVIESGKCLSPVPIEICLCRRNIYP